MAFEFVMNGREKITYPDFTDPAHYWIISLLYYLKNRSLIYDLSSILSHAKLVCMNGIVFDDGHLRICGQSGKQVE